MESKFERKDKAIEEQHNTIEELLQQNAKLKQSLKIN
jgi:hypothetical protein